MPDRQPQPTDIICPVCFARHGDPCRTTGDGYPEGMGVVLDKPHRERVRQLRWMMDPRNAP